MSTVDLSQMTLAILAGGQGTRMRKAKGELRIGGEPILAYLLERIGWPGATLVVTAPGVEHPPGGDRFHAEAIDPQAGLGPLRGVLTALQHATTDVMVITTVDLPNIRLGNLSAAVSRLMRSAEHAAVMYRRDVAGESVIEPFPLAIHKRLTAEVAARLASGRRSVYGLSQLPGVVVEAVPTEWRESVWMNLNTPEDMRVFLDSQSDAAQ